MIINLDKRISIIVPRPKSHISMTSKFDVWCKVLYGEKNFILTSQNMMLARKTAVRVGDGGQSTSV